MSFSGYSFCKPHSASYARVSFQAAYLKVHYPAEFMRRSSATGEGSTAPSLTCPKPAGWGWKFSRPTWH
ncbi:Error-prone repair homolog of DNA polymerase III alpha subunit (EC [Olavius algarvensis associated proteobacterium Delta 3]|nr:Error-prone repair homolog of DNA polymerase III alpha subunit (EC [Olavius algarvensis associated proteobacterium Delta 3]